MEHQRYVGILVSDLFHQRIPTGKTGWEELSFYEEACSQFGMKPCYLRSRDLTKRNSHVYAYIWVNGRYKRRYVPFPQVIHNRMISTHPRTAKTLDKLACSGTKIFNRRNRYSKLLIHELLLQAPELAPHLPATMAATLENVKKMQREFPSLIIKPVNSSIGRGVMRLTLMDNGQWELLVPQGSARKRYLFKKILPLVLRQRLRKRRHLVQQCIPLAQYKGRPFDLRISVQRGETGEWQVTGIVGKAAKAGSFITNVAQGGQAYPLCTLLEEYPLLEVDMMTNSISDIALRIANHLSLHLPDLADLGLDVGITSEGLPMFIEANGRDQRYSFREAGMLEEWKNTYRNPMGYAHFLSKS